MEWWRPTLQNLYFNVVFRKSQNNGESANTHPKTGLFWGSVSTFSYPRILVFLPLKSEGRFRNIMANILKILRFDRAKTPIHIFEQLRLEEALFRTDTNNWIVINDGSLASPSPSVVLGISGKPKVMCNIQRLEQENVPLFRRFTGGGTVVVGKGTTFISLIGNKKMLDPKGILNPGKVLDI